MAMTEKQLHEALEKLVHEGKVIPCWDDTIKDVRYVPADEYTEGICGTKLSTSQWDALRGW